MKRKTPTTESPPFAGLRAAIYSRKSNEDDATEELRSCTRQVERCREFAARKGWVVDDSLIFVDDGISGIEFRRRPGLARLLNAAEAKAFDVLIMSEPSRLGREQAQTNIILKQLTDARVAVWYYFEDRRAELDTAVGKFIESVHSFGSELERERIRQRTSDGLRKRAEAGHATGGFCFGYRSVPVYTGRQDAQGRPLADYTDRVIEPGEARAVAATFRMYLAGHGLTAIAKTLNGDPRRATELTEFFVGVRPLASSHGRGSWVAEGVREILRRPLYAGKLIWGASRRNGTESIRLKPVAPPVVIQREDLRIVDDVTWKATQARLTERGEAYLRQAGGRLFGRAEIGREAKYLWSGFLKCAWCGGGCSWGKNSTTRPAPGTPARTM